MLGVMAACFDPMQQLRRDEGFTIASPDMISRQYNDESVFLTRDIVEALWLRSLTGVINRGLSAN